MTKNFLFLYLNTGGGHIGPARAVEQLLQEHYTDKVSVEFYNGFNKKQHVAKWFFETGYRFTMSVLPAMYSFTYDITNRSPFWHMYYKTLVSFNTAKYLKKKLESANVDTIVCFHFALTYAAVKVLRKMKKKIQLIIVVTDPFSAHSLWFVDPTQKFIVFSEDLKKEMINYYGIKQSNIRVMPFLVNKKFLLNPSKSEITELKKKHGFPLDKKIVLLAGGGEGLPGALEIVTKCVQNKVDFCLAVVSGRNATAKNVMRVVAQANPNTCIKIFGFVSFMEELLQICDCAVIKCGTSSLIESLLSGKPIIISKYIHGQELGNMRFAVSTGCAWFIQHPTDIVNKLTELFSDETYYNSVTQKAASLHINTDTKQMADYLFNL